jgi:formate C-acetyltransferase
MPKYGNDDDDVDFVARDALALVCEEFPKYKNTRYGRGPLGGVFQASTTTVSSNTPFGRVIGALPDGRKAGTPLADGQSPFRGSDTLGPTAALNSVSKLRLVLLSEGSLYNMKLLPQDLRD